jgi:catechol 2,3-dioxygenase-like lactoylglutathione lyase family enzyme
MPDVPPVIQLGDIALDAPDPRALAEFYGRLLGWKIFRAEPSWVTLGPHDGSGPGLCFAAEPLFQRPVWPSESDKQQMMLHLDFGVADLEAACAHAIAAGATLADFQPQDDVRVFYDPVGHPFCLYVDSDLVKGSTVD